MEKILEDIQAERRRQDQKWGVQRHSPVEWVTILGEEYGEVCKAACEAHFPGYPSTGNWDAYREELVQTAAVCVAMLEALAAGKSDAPEYRSFDLGEALTNPLRHEIMKKFMEIGVGHRVSWNSGVIEVESFDPEKLTAAFRCLAEIFTGDPDATEFWIPGSNKS